MAITAYTGKPRSGKSYSVVVHVIIPALKAGRVVVTNIPLHLEAFPEEQQHLIIQIDIKQFAEDKAYFDDLIFRGSLFVLDECWRLFPAGVQVNNIPQHHKEFLAEHGHMTDDAGRSYDICFVTQDLSQISSFPRGLVETTYRTIKLTALGSRNKFRVDIYNGYVTGDAPPKSKLSGKSHFQTYEKKNFQYYKSHTKSDAEEVLEVSSDSRGSIFGGLLFKVFLPAAVVVFALSAYVLSGFFKPKETKKAPSPAPVSAGVPAVNAPPVPAPKPVVPPEPVLSTKTRLVGFSGYSDGQRVYGSVLVDHGNGSKPMRLPFQQNCKYLTPAVTRSIECKYQGEIVTFYTGATIDRGYKLNLSEGEKYASNP